MEDIRTLCKRSVVINHGVKIYDGGTEALFGDEEPAAVMERLYGEAAPAGVCLLYTSDAADD